jgi:hypothetical protein
MQSSVRDSDLLAHGFQAGCSALKSFKDGPPDEADL